MFDLFKSKKAEVLEHWIAFAQGFQLSSSEFYDSVERELKTMEVPGLEMGRVEFAEGSILSDKRTYLRMVRERLVFDVCAAPFGKTYFFSCRFAEIPAVIHLWQLIVSLASFSIIVVLTWHFAGLILGSLILLHQLEAFLCGGLFCKLLHDARHDFEIHETGVVAIVGFFAKEPFVDSTEHGRFDEC